MSPTMKLLLPGISAMFADLGYSVNLYDTKGLLVIRLTKGETVESRTYPYPQTNLELSEPLRAWRDELSGIRP